MNSNLIVAKYQLYAKVLRAHLQHSQSDFSGSLRSDRPLEKLNKIYSEESSEADPILNRMQLMCLPQEDW